MAAMITVLEFILGLFGCLVCFYFAKNPQPESQLVPLTKTEDFFS